MEISTIETLQQAIAAHQEGGSKEAEQLYRTVLKIEPTNLDANNNLGVLLYSLDRLGESEECFKKAIEYKSDFSEAYNNLGNTLRKLARLEEAEVNYKKAIKIKPDYVDAHFNLSIVLSDLGRSEEAKEVFNIGKSYQILDENVKAKDFCKKIVYEKVKKFPIESSFIYKEIIQRGFFKKSNLKQIQEEIIQLPLLTWSFLDFIKTLDLKNIILHELGSGNSTIWFSNIFKWVNSYETNQDWYKKLKSQLKKNVSLKLIKLVDLYECPIKFTTKDWLLIDFAGKRTRFIHKLVKLSDDQIPAQIILDNAEYYRNGAKILSDRGYVEIPFFGFKSGNTLINCTSLFILKNCFQIKNLSKLDSTNYLKRLENDWDRVD
tara:strand:+ start:55 stop:1182 length:1128 start_codon:yes stop_codon:yes gene_type:complete